uniref:KRAB domain-containing protein n=1 Tax=Monodelphis domestica TaxID=13616 RepID=F7ACM7_MONDO
LQTRRAELHEMGLIQQTVHRLAQEETPEPEAMRLPSQELITFKDVVLDFTKEESYLLDCSYKDLCMEVMLENVQNLLSVGLAVPRENFITSLQKGESPWLPEKKGQWSFYKEAETNFEVKEIFDSLILTIMNVNNVESLLDVALKFDNTREFTLDLKVINVHNVEGLSQIRTLSEYQNLKLSGNLPIGKWLS